MDIQARQSLRPAFLTWLYQATNGSINAVVDPHDFPAETACRHNRGVCPLSDAVDLLDETGHLIVLQRSAGGIAMIVRITAKGIGEVERPTIPTLAPAAADRVVHNTTINNFGHMGQTQVGTTDSAQTGTFTVLNLVEYRRFIAEARRLYVGLGDRERAQVEESLQAMEQELGSRSPRKNVLRALAQGAGGVLIGALGSSAGDRISLLTGVGS